MTKAVISRQNLNAELSSSVAKFDLLSVANSGQRAVTSHATATETKLGTRINDVVGGFQSVTQELDDVVSFVNGKPVVSPYARTGAAGLGSVGASSSIAESLAGFGAVAGELNNPLENADGVTNRGLALLTGNPTGLTIQNDVSSANSDIEALTEDAVEGGFLEFTITAAIPEAIANTLQKIVDDPIGAIVGAVQVFAPGIVGVVDSINNVINAALSGISIVNDFITSVTGFITSTITSLTQGLTGVINNVVESAVAPFESVISGIVTNIETVIPIDINLEIKANIELGFITEAAELLAPFTTLPLIEIESQLLSIPTTLSEMISNNSLLLSITTPVTIIGRV